MARWSSGLRLRPLTPATRVRISYGSPEKELSESLMNREIGLEFNLVGVNDGEGPPVPIPNTVVKLTSAENTWNTWEDRTMPTQERTGSDN